MNDINTDTGNAHQISKIVIKVYHKNLLSLNDESVYKRRCPFCENGILLLGREQKPPYTLQEIDCCILCGTVVRYEDIEVLRQRETLIERCFSEVTQK